MTTPGLLDMKDTAVSYVGGAETVVAFESTDVDKTKFHTNPDTRRKWFFTYGVRLKVAKYKGKLFFGRIVYFWDGFCSNHVFVDKDFELEKNFRERSEEPPEHTYRTSPCIEIAKGKDAIVDFARDFLNKETKNYKMKDHVDDVIRQFKEAL